MCADQSHKHKDPKVILNQVLPLHGQLLSFCELVCHCDIRSDEKGRKYAEFAHRGNDFFF